MQPHTITTELTTAWTNIPLGLGALGGMLWVWCRRVLHPLKAALWAGMFGSLMVACDLGIVAHGFELAPETSKLIRQVINAALALTVTCFAAGAARDGWGAPAARRILPGLLGLGAAFFYYATFRSETFLPFVRYEGAAWMTASVAITMLAAYCCHLCPSIRPKCGVVIPTAIWLFKNSFRPLLAAVVVHGKHHGGIGGVASSSAQTQIKPKEPNEGTHYECIKIHHGHGLAFSLGKRTLGHSQSVLSATATMSRL